MTGVERSSSADVVVVGGGPAGLTAARALRDLGIASVVVLEREAGAGGIPRHSDHPGYGVRDLRRSMSGPAYARRLTDDAVSAGVEIHTSSTVTGWAGERAVSVTSPHGRTTFDAGAVLLATGARERPRSARRVPGDRPDGVLTTGQLQDLVHLHHQSAGGRIGRRAVVVGSELVSWSAVLTLREAGCSTVLMTAEGDRPRSPAGLTWGGRTVLRVPVTRRTRVTRIIGRDRVTAVELTRLDTGQRTTVECDTVVFTADWIPDNELARLAGLQIDPAHLGPIVDTGLRTSADGVFAAGNLLHPVDTADVAALDGRHAAAQVRDWLEGRRPPAGRVRIGAVDPFAWVAPGWMRPGDVAPARGRLLLWPTEFRAVPLVVVRQGDRVVARRRLPWPMSPGRMFRVPWSMLADVRPGAGDVIIALA